jgi:hypothetical protein
VVGARLVGVDVQIVGFWVGDLVGGIGCGVGRFEANVGTVVTGSVGVLVTNVGDFEIGDLVVGDLVVALWEGALVAFSPARQTPRLHVPARPLEEHFTPSGTAPTGTTGGVWVFSSAP